MKLRQRFNEFFNCFLFERGFLLWGRMAGPDRVNIFERELELVEHVLVWAVRLLADWMAAHEQLSPEIAE